MHNCIFTSHCIEPMCDRSCPILTETSYLLDRNHIKLGNPVFRASANEISQASSILDSADSTLKLVVTDNTIYISNLLVYSAICQNWQGNRCHVNVYNLKFSNYIDAIQKGWSSKRAEESLEYEQIWANNAKILIISNIDYVQFKDFQAQTMLNLIHNRKNDGLTTIIVSPGVRTLVGSGMFFAKMQDMLREVVVKWR